MNRTISLIRYARVDGKGWRRGSVVLTKQGRIKPDVMIYGGSEIPCPDGRYQIVKHNGTKKIYTDLGNDPADALAQFKAAESKQSVRVAASRAGIELVEDDSTRKTIRQYAGSFLEMHANLPHRSGDSAKRYTIITDTFLSVCKARYPEDITQEDVILWCGYMQRELGYEPRTRADRYMSLRGFLRYCGVDPGKLIDRGTHTLLKKYTQKEPNMYEPEVVAKLIEHSASPNRALLWDFAYKTGLRDSELKHVTRHDLHGLDTKPMLHVKERDELGHIKDSEERMVELHPSLVPQLKRWLKENPTKKLLFGTVNDKPDTKMLFALKATARRAGLNCGHCTGCLRTTGKNKNECGEYTLHRFRRTYTTRMLKACEGDLRSVMKRTGHSDLASVMRYLAPSAHVREALAKAF